MLTQNIVREASEIEILSVYYSIVEVYLMVFLSSAGRMQQYIRVYIFVC